ncbi:MAG: hypothetical protein K6G55_08840 [Selenomonadaceae bacterium]|nr:hypothetical protein [Selenomonadaceae bacterium]
MSEKKSAFESDKISIAFSLTSELDNAVVGKKVFDALIKLAPDCMIDIFCPNERAKTFAKAVYSDSANLNLISINDAQYKETTKKYDLAILIYSTHFIILQNINEAALKNKSPKLFNAIVGIHNYNTKNVYNVGADNRTAFRNMMMAGILKQNCFAFLSCNGALPIHDDKVNISLSAEYKSKFDALKLGKYIAIYSDMTTGEKTPKAKTWPLQYLTEYISRMKKMLPQVEIIQIGGEKDVKIENVNRHLLSDDLELTKYLLANALLVVGDNCGYVHLATALGTKCVVLFGQSSADYFGYDRNINIASEVCSPCRFFFQNENICMREEKEPLCMLGITPKLVSKITCTHLKHILD